MRVRFTIAVLGLVVAGCGGSGASDTTSSTVPGESTTTSAPAVTTTLVASTSTSSPAATTTLAGDPVDIGPPAGAVLGVIGVRYDDVLNLRAGPGADQPIIGQIPPAFDDLVASGEVRSLPAFWTKVSYQGTEGWVNMRYLAYLGSTDDITARFIDLFGERPEASTMAELGEIVAEALASEDPASDLVNSVEESVGDLGEVTFDVVGLGDDAVRGLRLHVFAENLDGHFQLRTVEQTILCDPSRGVDEGSCV